MVKIDKNIILCVDRDSNPDREQTRFWSPRYRRPQSIPRLGSSHSTLKLSTQFWLWGERLVEYIEEIFVASIKYIYFVVRVRRDVDCMHVYYWYCVARQTHTLTLLHRLTRTQGSYFNVTSVRVRNDGFIHCGLPFGFWHWIYSLAAG